MKTAILKKVACLGAALALVSGCYSTKMMDLTYQELDTVKTQQQELMNRIDALSQKFEEEREERVRSQAEQAMTLRELRELLDVLAYRVDDTSQLILSTRRTPQASLRPAQTPTEMAPVDSARVLPPDSSRRWSPDSLKATPPSDDDSEPDKLFKSSYMDLTLGNYDLAVQGFKNYLVRYPNAENLPGAHYYLGDSYYALSRYLEAVAEFQVVIRQHSRSRFAPAAYLKSGFCYQRLDETDLAERSFRELISLYPRTEEAEQARVALRDLGG